LDKDKENHDRERRLRAIHGATLEESVRYRQDRHTDPQPMCFT
jgi:hypothetical protein